jgi:hypothetical protein
MSIYMSFRMAQDHNKAAGRDTNSSTASSTRWEVPVATMWHHSSCFAFTCHSFCFGFPSHELHCLKVVEVVSVLLVINYLVYFIMCVIICCVKYIPIYCACFGGSPFREAVKTSSSKKSSYIRRLTIFVD